MNVMVGFINCHGTTYYFMPHMTDYQKNSVFDNFFTSFVIFIL